MGLITKAINKVESQKVISIQLGQQSQMDQPGPPEQPEISTPPKKEKENFHSDGDCAFGGNRFRAGLLIYSQARSRS